MHLLFLHNRFSYKNNYSLFLKFHCESREKSVELIFQLKITDRKETKNLRSISS